MKKTAVFLLLLIILCLTGCMEINEPIVDTDSTNESIVDNGLTSEEEFINIVKSNLGVPDEADVTYSISEEYYWDAGQTYFVQVDFYENDTYVAGASVHPETGELIKSIYNYYNPNNQ